MTTKSTNAAKSCFERILRTKPSIWFVLADIDANRMDTFSERALDGIRARCQHHSWKEWKRSGTEIIDAHVRPDSEERARDLLNLVIENRQRLIDKITLAEKSFQKRKKSISRSPT